MVKSEKWAKIIVCGLMALFSSASFAAWTTNVTDGMTFEMTSVAGTNAQTDFNVYASFIDCSGTCTVKILNDGGDDVRPRFRLAAGTVLTIDMTARSSSARFNGGLFAEEGAKIIVKSDFGNITLGRDGSGSSSYAVLNVDDISFVDSNGDPVPGTVRFWRSNLWLHLPSGVTFAYSTKPSIYAYGAGVLAAAGLVNGSGEVSFSGFELIDPGQGDISAGQTVRVGANGTFKVLPCTTNAAATSLSWTVDWTNDRNVVLEDSTATFAIGSQYPGDFTGTLTGAGRVRMETHSGDYLWSAGTKNRVTFSHAPSVSGALALATEKAHLELAAGGSFGSFSSASGAYVLVPGSNTFTVTGESSDGRVRVASGGALTLNAGTGTLIVEGDTRLTSSFSLAALSEGGQVKYRPTVGASSSVVGVREVETGAGGLFFLGECDFANIDIGIKGVKTIALSGTGNNVSSLAADYEIELADASSSARIVADATNTPSIRLNGGTITLVPSDSVTNILNRALLWCDASAEGTWTQNIYNDSAMTYTVLYGNLKNNVYPVVDYWHDVRGAQAYAFRRLPTNNSANYISPYRVTGDWNGPYMNLDVRDASGKARACRFRITRNGSPENNVAAKLVVMVFDSSPGGGKAVLGNKDGDFARASEKVTSPILPSACTDCAVWLDGEAQADPTACYFSGGWQIVTIDPGTHTISGLALPDDTNTHAGGGMNVAEILIFTEELTDTERLRVERYLAEKWGLASQYKGGTYSNPVEARVYGAGTIALETDAALGGVYTGTVALAGHTLDLPVCAAPTDDEVAAIADRTGWFDPSVRSSMDFHSSSYSPSLVKHLNDRVLGKSDGAWMIYGHQIARGPYRRDDGWLDLRAGSSGAIGKVYPDGALIRLNQWSNNVDTTTISPMPVRTVIMAMDSSGGGGTPLGTAVDVTRSDLGQRIAASDAAAKFTKSDYTSPIWPSDAKSEYTSAAVYLDGVAVNATVRGFNGRKEVFSTVFGTDLALGVFSDYQRNTYTNALGEVQGEILGEMLMFSRELEDSERNLVEAYLMRKWCGTTLPGYGDFTGATVTGAGTVNVPCVAAAPKFDSGFTGTVVFTNETLSFTIDATVSSDAAANAVVAANGTVSLPAAVTIEVEIVPPAVVGSYTLLSADTLPDPLDLTLSVNAGSSGKNAFALRRAASAIILDILPKGMIVIVR